jgi:hypothetical protein
VKEGSTRIVLPFLHPAHRRVGNGGPKDTRRVMVTKAGADRKGAVPKADASVATSVRANRAFLVVNRARSRA